MGQSLLIDINSGWYKHKTEVNDGLKTRNYSQVKGSLNALNALLPGDYRIIIDDDLYQERIKGNLVALCGHCTTVYDDPKNKENVINLPTQHDYSKIKILHILLDSLERVAYNKTYDDFWSCGTCHKLNRLSQTKFKQIVFQKPYYLQVVPEPPRQRQGVQDRNSFHNRFETWARNFLAELNAQAQRFRQEYRPKDGDGLEEFEAGFEDDDDL